MQWLLIGLGAAFGAMLRALLARFNQYHEWMLLGTLAANVLGGFLIGIALVYLDKLLPNTKYFVVTGFLGGLTTFSTFSAEVFTLLNTGKYLQAIIWVVLQVCLTILATVMAFALFKQVA